MTANAANVEMLKMRSAFHGGLERPESISSAHWPLRAGYLLTKLSSPWLPSVSLVCNLFAFASLSPLEKARPFMEAKSHLLHRTVHFVTSICTDVTDAPEPTVASSCGFLSQNNVVRLDIQSYRGRYGAQLLHL